MRVSLWRGLWLTGLALCLAGCAWLGTDQLAAGPRTPVSLGQGDTLGQTFTARWAGLRGVEVYLAPEVSGAGHIRLTLWPSPQESGELAQSRLSLDAVQAPGFHRFDFPPQSDTNGRDYYLSIAVDGPGRVLVGNGPGESYLDGALYRQGEPADAQLSFRLVYDPWWMLAGAVRQALGWAGVAGLGLLAFVLPGWALLAMLWPAANNLGRAERLGLAIGLSLAVYPVLMLWTDLVGLRLGPLHAWLPIAGAVAVLGARGWRNRPRLWWWPIPHPERSGARPSTSLCSPVEAGRDREASLWDGAQDARRAVEGAAIRPEDTLWPGLALAFVTALVFLVRFWMVRGLDVPLWGDSLHHTMIAQLIVDQGGLFASWQPYAELRSLNYHFGFHALAAVFHWLSGEALPRAVLWAGQILNALAVLAVYPLAARAGRSSWAGVGAVLVAGLLAPMPNFYVNWGRYTQLAGQAILPAAVFMLWTGLRAERIGWRVNVLSWILLGGLALTHYRVLIFALFFPLAVIGAETLAGLSQRSGRLFRQPGAYAGGLLTLLARTFWLGVGGALLFLPWFAHTYGGVILGVLFEQLSTPASGLSAFTEEYNAVGDLRLYLPPVLWLLVLLSAAWGVLRRDRLVVALGLWWLLLGLAANPHRIGLPGTGALSNFALFIAVYIPAGVLTGAALGWLMDRLAHRRAAGPAALVVIATLAAAGAIQRLGDLRLAESVLAARPDVRAAAWIRQNTPADSRFLVNAFFAYADTLIVGSDGGWWLPLLAHRQTSLPPISYASEQGPRPDYREWVNALAADVLENGVDDLGVRRMLAERGITHVYIGQRQGRVNYAGPLMLDPAVLAQSENYRLVYHEDRVWIFEVVPP